MTMTLFSCNKLRSRPTTLVIESQMLLVLSNLIASMTWLIMFLIWLEIVDNPPKPKMKLKLSLLVPLGMR